jgi:DNA-directed RNA polymerase subunit RPC12/RpoP
MEQQNEIRCPKCNSNQLTANKKGFSGKKAVVGGLLTGGIGLLAGTIGSNKVIITCLACGNEFKPGEGQTKTNTPVEKKEKLKSGLDTQKEELDERKRVFASADTMDEALFKILKEGFVRGAVNHYKKTMNVSEEVATEYVEKFIVDNNLTDKVKRKGCFIATACYGDYDAPEVLILRKYRDEKLAVTSFGRLFIETYYLVSPFFARTIEKSEFLKRVVRNYFLQKLIKSISSSNEK